MKTLFIIVLLALPFSATAQTTLAIGQPDTAASTSSNAQIWPGCASGCMSVNPAYVMLPGASRRVWTNVCSGTNQWGGSLSNVPNCTYPASIAVTWTLNSGPCTVPAGQTTAFGTITTTAGGTTGLCSITVTTVQDATVSVTFHVLKVVTAADALGNSASMALHYCGVSGVATCTYVAPFYEVLYKGQYADVQAFLEGNVNTKVTWAVSPNNGGLAIQNGTSNRDLAVKGVNAGTYTLTATSVADGTSTAAATIVVTANNLAGQTRTSKVIPVDCTPEGSGTTYNVTDDTSFGAVPWDTLQPGDTVTIHAKAALAAYAIPFQIKTSGTPTQPIRICGIPDGSGNLPILTGVNAGPGNVTAAQQPYGMVVLVSDSGGQNVNCSVGSGCSQPPEPDTHSVIVEGLKVISAWSAYGRTGGAAAWQAGSASFRVEARDILLRGNEVTDSNDGIFVGSNSGRAETQITRRLAVEGNYIYGNGDLTGGSSSFHNNYLQGDMGLFQWNWVGIVRSGAQGSSVKSRMAYMVVRYNYVQGSARTLDMVEVQDWADSAIPTYFYADNYGAANTGIADIASVVQNVQADFVYGNVFDNNSLLGGPQTEFPFHYFCDVFPNAEKGGIDYFYGNTDREIHDHSGTYADDMFFFDSTTGNCAGGGFVPFVWPRFELTNNAIDMECATAACANGNFYWSWAVAYQDQVAMDKNWFTTAISNLWGGVPAQYWTGCCSDPTDHGTSCFQTTCNSSTGTTLVTGLGNLIMGSSVPFNSTTFIPPNGSPLLNATVSLPAGVADLPPEFNYEPDNQAISFRTDLSANLPSTLGALAGTGASSTQGVHFGLLP